MAVVLVVSLSAVTVGGELRLAGYLLADLNPAFHRGGEIGNRRGRR